MNNFKVSNNKNIASPSVFTSQEFLKNAEVTILTGASETDLKNSLNMTSGLANISHYSDDNDEQEPATTKANSLNSTCKATKSASIMKEELAIGDSTNVNSAIKMIELEKVNTIENKRGSDILDTPKSSVNMPKKKKLKKNLKEDSTTDSTINLIEAMQSAVTTVKSENIPTGDLESKIDKQSQHTRSVANVAEAIQPDEEIKELLKNDNISASQSTKIMKKICSPNLINSSSSPNINSITVGIDQSVHQFNNRKITTDELKDLIQKEKQTTAELFKQLLKSQEADQAVASSTSQQQPNYMHQNSNSSDIAIAELSSIHNNMNNTNIPSNQSFFQQQHLISQRIKSTTPSCVDQLLISPLFNQFLPSCGSTSSNSSNSSSSCSSLNANLNQNTNNANSGSILSFSQFAAAAVSAAKSSNNMGMNTRKTPLSFLLNGGIGNGELEEIPVNNSSNNVNTKITHASRSSFKRTKHTSNNSKSKQRSIHGRIFNPYTFFDQILNGITNNIKLMI